MRAHLDLYAARKYSTVKLGDGSEYKLPNEYTVEEVERVLELHEEIEALEQQEVVGDGKAQRERHTALIFAQLEVMFGHYQPDITAEQLQKVITHNEALEIVGFFRKYRHTAFKELRDETAAQKAESKKKVKLNSAKELRELRRMVTFMVTCGFSLYELRKLYIDELHAYYLELLFLKEQKGEIKKGSYDKIKSRSNPSEVVDTVALLRKQMFKSIADLNKKKKT